MDLFTTALATRAIQGLAQGLSRSESDQTELSDDKSSNFDSLLRGVVDPELGNKINEEELYAGLLYERIHSLKGAEAAEQYQKALQESKQQLTRSDGYVWVEDAANAALEKVRELELISNDEFNEMKSQAHRAAQLDDNHDVLWDGRGSASDPTIAIAELDVALQSARTLLERIDSGESLEQLQAGKDITSNSELNSEKPIRPKGTNVDGPGGFLFKPISESDGKLVVLLPANLAYQVSELILKDADGNKIDKGRHAGYHNEGREHFRFSKAGRRYPDNLTVEVRFHDGSTRNYLIPDPAKRYD